MANPWFRLYSEFADDPKVQIMSEAMQRRLIMLMCSRCKDETLHETQLAFHWRISPHELAQTKAVFIANGFIDENWELLNWNRRQFISDSSTDRVRRYREGKKRNETLHSDQYDEDETGRNVTVTPPDTDTDAEQTQNRTEETLALTSDEARAASPKRAKPDPSPGIFELPLPGEQGEWQVSQKLYDEMVKAYPALTVMEELGEMRAWLVTNESNRKTAKGMPKFINNWLSRSQNKARIGGGSNGAGKRGSSRHDSNRETVRRVLGEFDASFGSEGNQCGTEPAAGDLPSVDDAGRQPGPGSAQGRRPEGSHRGDDGDEPRAVHSGAEPGRARNGVLPYAGGAAAIRWPS